jgi:hypothetical protein
MAAKNKQYDGLLFYEGYLVRTKSKIHGPGPFKNFEHLYDLRIKNLNPGWDVSPYIGNEGSKILYHNGRLFMEWIYHKMSGEHKKNNGIIKINASRLEDDILATLKVKKSHVFEITVNKPQEFLDEIEKNPYIPLHDNIEKLFYKINQTKK